MKRNLFSTVATTSERYPVCGALLIGQHSDISFNPLVGAAGRAALRLLMLILALTLPSTANAQLALDSSQTTVDYGFGVTRSDLPPRWQEFIPAYDNLERIDLWIMDQHRVDSVLRVSVTDSTGATLWSVSLPDSALPSAGWLVVDTPHIEVVPGLPYRVNLSIDKYPNDGNPSGSVFWMGSTVPSTHYLNDTSTAWPTYSYAFHTYAALAADPLLPTIIRPPQTRTAEVGSTVRLQVLANSPLPLSYQWFGNTNAIVGSTNSFLVLTNVQFSQKGIYTVLVSNRFGVVTSDAAKLQVIPPVRRRVIPALGLIGEVGSPLNLSFASKLGPDADWRTLDVVTLTNAPQLYFDISESPPLERFYRSWQTNVAAANPALQISLATEIQLTGAIGSKLRIDYINAFGPIDAWVTLDTLTLSRTEQFYFDAKMFRQPPRLYRIIPVP